MVTTLKRYLAGILVALAAFFAIPQSYAQITLAFQGGELGDTWNYSGASASASALTEATLPANKTTGTKSLVCGGDTGGGNCFGSGSGNGPDITRTFDFDPVNLSGSNQFTHTLTFNWGNRFPACVGTGWDAGEDLVFTPFYDGVPQGDILIVAGNENAQFDIHTHSFSYDIPPCVVDFYFSVSVTTNRADELLFLDDVKLTAPQLNVTLGQPGAITGPTLMCLGTGSMCDYIVPNVPGTTYVWYGLSGGALFNIPNGENTMTVNWAPVPVGTYTLMVAAADACGNVSGPPQQIQVQISGPTPPPVISGPVSMCNGETVTLTSSQTNNIEWSNGATTPSINVNSPGTYTLEYINGCGTTATVSYTISLSSGIAVTTTVTPVSCNGLSDGAIQVNSQTSNLDYTLNGGTSQSSNIFNGLSAGTYTIGVVSASGCTGQTTAVITQPAPLVVTAVTSGFLCEGEDVQLNGSVNMTGTAVYSWTGPNGFTAIDQTPHGILEPGNYHLDVVVNGCTGSADLSFVLSPPPVVQFTSTEVCEGNPTEFSSAGSSATAPDQLASFVWSFGDGLNGIAANMNHTYLTAGIFTATLELTTQNGCTASLTQDVGVNEVPNADFSYLPHEIAISNPTVQFTNLSILADSYEWNFDYNGETSTEFSPGFVYPQADGTYEVLLVAMAANGCGDSIRKSITIGNGLVYYIPNSFTPNGDGINDIFLPVFTSGIDESEYVFTLFNRWGEVLFESTDVNSGWDGKLDSELVEEGTYVWSIRFKYKENADHEMIAGHVVLLK